MAVGYNNSRFGKRVVVYESSDELTYIRTIFIIGTIIVGTITLLKTLICYYQLVQRHKHRFSSASRLPFLVKFVYFLFILNIIIHNAHYADNIYRPVAYYEPKWLYDKYLVSTMEITFFANFPILLLGSVAIKSMFNIDRNGMTINR